MHALYRLLSLSFSPLEPSLHNYLPESTAACHWVMTVLAARKPSPIHPRTTVNGRRRTILRSDYTRRDSPRLWREPEARMATYRGKIHDGISVLGIQVVRGKLGKIEGLDNVFTL